MTRVDKIASVQFLSMPKSAAVKAGFARAGLNCRPAKQP